MPDPNQTPLPPLPAGFTPPQPVPTAPAQTESDTLPPLPEGFTAPKPVTPFNQGVAAVKEAGDPFLSAGEGFVKSAAEHALGAVQLVNRGLRAVPGLGSHVNPMPDPETAVKIATGDKNATLENHGVFQNAGGFAEGAAEFLLGDEALKGLSWADRLAQYSKAGKLMEQYPRLARIIGNAMRVGAVGAGQSLVDTGGENPVESLKTGAAVGATAGAIEGAATVAKPLAEKAFTYLNNKGAIRALNTDAIRENLFPNANLAGTTLSKAIQSDLDTVEHKLINNYGTSLEQFAKEADEKGIVIGEPGSPLALKAKDLLDSSGKGLSEALQGALKKARAPGMERVEPLLEERAKGDPLTWQQAVELRKAVGNLAYNSDYADPAKQALNGLRDAIDDNFEKAATDSGSPELEQGLRNLRADYHETITSLRKNAVIKGLQNNDLDTVAATLMRNNAVAGNVGTLRTLLGRIGSKNMESVEGSIFDKLAQRSTVTKGTGPAGTDTLVDAKKFIQNFRNIPEDVREAIWGDKAAEINKILQDASQETLVLKAGIEKYITAQNGLHGATGLAIGGAMYAAYHGSWHTVEAALTTALASEGIKNPKVQKYVLGLLQYASTFTEHPIGKSATAEGVEKAMPKPEKE